MGGTPVENEPTSENDFSGNTREINQVVGFLAAGLLLGPHGMPSWSGNLPWLASLPFPSPPEVEQLANLGVIFLMFLIGLGLPLGRVWELRAWVLRTGSAQIAFSTIAIGLIAYTLGQPRSAAMVLGLVLSLSSTAVVIQLLTQRHLLETPLGQAVFSVLMMQDLVVLPTLVLIDLLAQPQPAPWGALLWIGLKSVFAVTLILVVGKPLMAPLFRAMTRHRQPEVFVALTLLAALGVGGLTAVAGFSMTLGAFLAGMLLAETEFRHE
ncbi:MAG: potassium transporter, partial [Betaproteobacteria bacterium]|nr:potassium transporter [Betaproteobacteria bacterium]